MTELWVERTGSRRYTGYSSRGAQVLVGSEDVEGVFTPGELLKIALAACSGMSTDQPLSRRLGDDYKAVLYDRPATLLGSLLGIKAPAAPAQLDASCLADGATPRLWYLAPQCEMAGVLKAIGRQ